MSHRSALLNPVLLAAFALLGAGCMSPSDAPPSASSTPVDYVPDAGPPSPVQVKSHGNPLPPAWSAPSAGDLSADGGSADAQSHLSELTSLKVKLTVSNNPCPLQVGQYCDGFSGTQDDGGTVVVDTFTYLGNPSNLPCTLPSSGTLQSVSGVWEDKYDATAKTDIFVLALTDCSDIGQGTPYSGSGAPGTSTDIANLVGSFAPGNTVTVQGVVVAATGVSSSGAFSFTIEDPAGGPKAGIAVVRSASSTSTANTPPAVGDLVQVTGTTQLLGQKRVINL